jgi:hypothetical protein
MGQEFDIFGNTKETEAISALAALAQAGRARQSAPRAAERTQEEIRMKRLRVHVSVRDDRLLQGWTPACCA